MDVAAIKKNLIDAAQGGKPAAGSTEQLMSDFSAAVAARLSHSSPANTSHGKNALVSHLGAKADVQREPLPQEESSQNMANEVRDDHAPAHRSDDAPARDHARHDDADTDASAQSSAAAGDAPREEVRQDTHAEHGDDHGHHEAAQTDGTANPQAAAAQNQNPAQTAANTPAQMAAAQIAGAGGHHGQTDQAAQVLAGNAADAASAVNAAGDAAPKQNALNGLETAQAAVAAPKTNAGEAKSGGDDQVDAHAKSEKSAKGTASQNQAATQNQGETQQAKVGGANVAQQQADDLSRKVGPNEKINVNVNATKASEELVSQPAATLGAQALVAQEGDGLAENAASAAKGQTLAQQGAAGNGGAGQQSGQNGADAQTQNQQLTQPQFAQADAARAAQTATDAKGNAAQNVNTITAAQAAKAGGAEGATPVQTTPTAATPAQTQQAHAKTQAQNAAPQAHAKAQVTEQVTVQISKAISDGVDTIRIQLKPAHLGRVDVQIEMNQDGRMTAVISADNKDTLDLLKQDSRELQRALREAGLELGNNDLSFNLRGQNGREQGDAELAQQGGRATQPLKEPTLEELLQTQPMRRDIITADRVDVTA